MNEVLGRRTKQFWRSIWKSTLLLSHCSHYRQTVTATESLRSVVFRVVTARSEKFADMEGKGDDDGASAQTALAIRTLCALCRTVTATVLLAIEIVRFPYQMITLKRVKLLLMSRTRTGKVRSTAGLRLWRDSAVARAPVRNTGSLGPLRSPVAPRCCVL